MIFFFFKKKIRDPIKERKKNVIIKKFKSNVEYSYIAKPITINIVIGKITKGIRENLNKSELLFFVISEETKILNEA